MRNMSIAKTSRNPFSMKNLKRLQTQQLNALSFGVHNNIDHSMGSSSKMSFNRSNSVGRIQLTSEKARILDQESNTGTLNSKKGKLEKRKTLTANNLEALNIPRSSSFMSKEVKMEKIKHSPLARLDISPAPSTIFENVHKNKSRKIKRSNIIKKKHPIKINPGSFQKHKLFSKNRNLGEVAQGKLSQLKNRFTKAQSKIVQRRRNKSTMRNYGTLEGIGGNKTRRFKSPDVSRNNLHAFSRNTTSRNTPSVSPGILESSFLSQKNNGRYLVASPDPSKFFRSPMPHVKTKKEEEKLPNIC